MRHLKAHRKLGRTTEHRISMLRNLATSLINSREERIVTTVPKAKELRPFVERAITLSKVPAVKPLIDTPRMASLVEDMLHRSLDAFVKRDAALAATVLPADDEVDSIRDNSKSLRAFRVDRQHLALSASVGFPIRPRSRKRDPISEPQAAEIEGARLVGSASLLIRA